MSPIDAAEASLASTTRAGIDLILSCWKARQRRSPAISWNLSPCLRTTIGCRRPSLADALRELRELVGGDLAPRLVRAGLNKVDLEHRGSLGPARRERPARAPAASPRK
jgi:hypothetical protein